jgi:serine protease
MLNQPSVSVLSLSIALALLTASSASFANLNKNEQVKSVASNTSGLTDQLIIRFKDTTSATAADAVLRKLQTEKGEKFRYARSTQQKADIFRFNKRKSKAEWDNLNAWLKQQPEVEYVEPDYVLNKMALPNDSYISYQWPLTDSNVGIRAEQAWATSTGLNTVVAVLDTGYLPHADLVANILPGYDMINDSFVGNDGNGRDADAFDPGDYVLAGECNSTTGSNSSWHGTHVAGTIAAVANNASGVAGVAYNAKILPVRVLGKCGGYTSDIADGILWASGNSVTGVPANPTPARVINMSLGGANACSTTLQNAINAARSKNTVVIAAAGNSNLDASQFAPANCNGVVTVAATGRNGGKAYYSNFGSIVDIAAPGGSMSSSAYDGILSTLNAGTQAPTSDNYAFYQGTSMATPHVAGTAALMLSANPALTPDQVESLLKSTARTFPASCSGCGTGLMDANAAVQAALTVVTPPTDSYAALKATLTTNRNVWTSKAIKNYSYILEKGSQKFKLTIRSGKAYSGVDLNTNRSLSKTALNTYGKTVEQLFAVIDTAITNKAASVNATYDVSLGYPSAINIDQNTSVVGDESSYKAYNLVKN